MAQQSEFGASPSGSLIGDLVITTERALRARFPNVDLDVIHDAVIDTLVENSSGKKHIRHRDRASIYWASFRKVLDSLKSVQARSRRELRWCASAQGTCRYWENRTYERKTVAAEAALGAIADELPDDRLRSVLSLLVQGVRSTKAFANELDLGNLPASEQTSAVKREKDRL